MADSRAERITRILAIVTPGAMGDKLIRAINFTGKVLDAIDQIDGVRKRRPRADLTVDELRAFNRFYSVYPLKRDRGHAENMFRWALAQTDIETIVQGAVRYAEHVKGVEPSKIAHPGTWLKGKRWLDEYDAQANGHAAIDDISRRRETLLKLARNGVRTLNMTPDIIDEAKRLGPL
jgi:hypothetical protein